MENKPTWGEVLEVYNRIIDNSGYSTKALAAHDGKMTRAKLHKYLGGETIPNKKTIARLEKIVKFASTTKRIERHQSFGYATPEQMAKLGGYLTEQRRAEIMKKIEIQTKNEGRTE